MTTSFRKISTLAIVALLAGSPVCQAQQAVAAGAASGSDSRALDDLLSRSVSIDVTHVSLKQAIDVLSERAGVPFQYKDRTVEAYTALVTVHLTNVPLRAAIERILSGTSLVVVLDGTKRLAIVDGASEAGQAAGGVVSGKISSAKTRQPLADVSVWLDDSTHAVRSDSRGHYQFANVLAGSHRVLVRAVGFARQVRIVAVADDRTTTVDFALESNVNTLDQVVVTATGEQRYRELGHVVAQINADSLVKSAPISSVADLLQSRVPGLQVLTGNGGVAGGPVSLRLRGTSSLSLSSEPIVIVDGVRYRSSNQIPGFALAGVGFDIADGRGLYGTEPSSPLNDLNVNDIESVEIVKGPSASTLYGPDASNGVIVITTKRGQAGQTRWNWYLHPLANSVPTQDRVAQQSYTVWSHAYDDPSTAYPGTCTLQDQYQYHNCVIDSVTLGKTIFADPQFTTIGSSKPTWQYGLNVGGGSQALSYYFSGDYFNQLGNIQIPTIVQNLLKQDLGVSSLGDAARHPSTLQNISTHWSVTASPSSAASLTAIVDYHQVGQRTFSPDYFLTPGQALSLPVGATGVMGDSLTDQWVLANYGYVSVALSNQENQNQHVTGALQGTFRPIAWLTGSASMGLDIDQQTEHDDQPSDGYGNDGTAVDERRSNVSRTGTINLVADNQRHPLGFRTSLGVNYVYRRLDGLNAYGYNVAAGSNSIGTAGSTSLTPLWDETVELGMYGEEVVGLAEQLFLNLGMRVDGSTRFGDAYHPAALPKLGLSWVASDAPFLQRRLPGIENLRFRTSVGSATRYPTTTMKLGALYSNMTSIYGQSTITYGRQFLQDPGLRPERSREWEYGVDGTLLSRLTIGVTWHTKRVTDELALLQLPLGLPAVWGNVATVSQHGFEATAEMPLFATRSTEGTLAFTYSYQTSKVLSTGQNPASSAVTQYKVGYPIDAVFGNPVIGVADTVGGGPDGIYEYGEVIKGGLTYMGVYDPPTTMVLTPTIRLFNGIVNVSSAFDRETGAVAENRFGSSCASALTCKAAYLSTTPILLQAQLWDSFTPNAYFIRSADFTRWRELNVSVQIPGRFLRIAPLHIGFSSATISLQGRNLALWTPFAGTDPESNADLGLQGSNRNGIPQTRSWGFRFDVTP